MENQMQNHKSLLAKLMATENITVEQRNVRTASFNVKDRILIIPTLNNDIPEVLYDLFLGHEVSHALYTPEIFSEKIKEHNLNHSVVNVVEDSRIERFIKDKYPGLRLSFSGGYKNLWERDFFEVRNKNKQYLNLIDRINLFEKIGYLSGVKFSSEEKILLDKVRSTLTFDDVLEVSKELQEYMKEQYDKNNQEDQESNELDDESDGYMKWSGQNDELGDDVYDEDDGRYTESDESDDGITTDQDLTDNDGHKAGTGAHIGSETNESFERNRESLYVYDGKNRVYANLPKIDYSNVLVDYKKLVADLKDRIGSDLKTNLWYGTGEFFNVSVFRKEISKTVSYLVKEFELKKNAEQLRKVSVAKTGDLDLPKIFSYSFSEDIFRKISVVPGGKSHGLVIYLDWSGSMHKYIHNTIKQLLSIVFFCKKVNIPFEVYAFTDQYDKNKNVNQYTQKAVINDLYLNDFTLMNVLSSRMNNADMSYMANVLLNVERMQTPNWFHMGGTPLNQAIITAIDLVPQFKQSNKLNIVNTVFLTDGEGYAIDTVWSEYTDSFGVKKVIPQTLRYSKEQIVVRHNKSKEECLLKGHCTADQTKAFLDLFKRCVGSNIVGFYVLNSREFRYMIPQIYGNSAPKDEIASAFRKNNFAIAENQGFDEYYYIDVNNAETDEEFEVTPDSKGKLTTRRLVSAFTKHHNRKVDNRILLNRFIKMIA